MIKRKNDLPKTPPMSLKDINMKLKGKELSMNTQYPTQYPAINHNPSLETKYNQLIDRVNALEVRQESLLKYINETFNSKSTYPASTIEIKTTNKNAQDTHYSSNERFEIIFELLMKNKIDPESKDGFYACVYERSKDHYTKKLGIQQYVYNNYNKTNNKADDLIHNIELDTVKDIVYTQFWKKGHVCKVIDPRIQFILIDNMLFSNIKTVGKMLDKILEIGNNGFIDDKMIDSLNYNISEADNIDDLAVQFNAYMKEEALDSIKHNITESDMNTARTEFFNEHGARHLKPVQHRDKLLDIFKKLI